MSTEEPAAPAAPAETAAPPQTTPARARGKAARRGPGTSPDSLLMRLVATAGIIGIGVAIGAVVDQGWTAGLIVSLTSIVLTAIVWGPRRV